MRCDSHRCEIARGAEIARIINGGWQLSAGHSSTSRDRRDLLDALLAYVEAGLNTFDCADIYTGVEELFGELREEASQCGHEIRVHTKYVPDLDSLQTLRRRDVEAIIDRSLRRLRVERLDLVQFHWWDFSVPRWVETAEYLDVLRQKGKIRHLGVTNFDVEHLRPILSAGVEIVSNQVQYSLLDRRPEKAMVNFCAEHDMHLLCYGAAAGGFLGARWHEKPEPDEIENRSLVKYRLIIEEIGGWTLYQELLAALTEIAAKHEVSPTAVALHWVLSRPRVAGTIVGVRHGRHLRDNLRVFDLKLDAADQALLGDVIERFRDLPGSVFALEREPGGRHTTIMKTNLNRS